MAIANALRVTVADLLGQPGGPTDPPKGDAAGAASDIWTALLEIDDGERGGANCPADGPSMMAPNRCRRSRTSCG